VKGDPLAVRSKSRISLARRVSEQAARKLRSQRVGKRGVWFGLGMAGLIGWSVALPTVLGALLGGWWDRNHPGAHSWTLALLVAGLAIGCANAWRWISAERVALQDESKDEHE
jgi:ATP synthase protein I